MKIILTGASGTGKTTILNLFKQAGWNTITEVARKLQKEQGIALNEQGTAETQELIWKTYKKLFKNTEEHWVSDRGLTDVISYTKIGCETHPELKEVYKKQSADLKKFRGTDDAIYIFFPIEFPIEADGVRSTDEGYHKKISDQIESELNKAGITYCTVHGTVEERMKQIIDWIGPDNF